MTGERFISQALEPLTAGADTTRMASGEPGLPERFRWRGQIIEVHQVLRRWKSTGPCSHGSPELYVRRHWFEVTSSRGRLKLYFERQPRRGAKGPRWWLYSLTEEAGEAPPARPAPAAPPELQTAIRQFNAGEYYACHETLEELWLAERGSLRLLYQGVLMIGVGLLHLQRHNASGARGLLERGGRQLQAFAPACLGIDVQRLIRESEKVLQVLATEGPEPALARAGQLFPRIHRASP